MRGLRPRRGCRAPVPAATGHGCGSQTPLGRGPGLISSWSLHVVITLLPLSRLLTGSSRPGEAASPAGPARRAGGCMNYGVKWNRSQLLPGWAPSPIHPGVDGPLTRPQPLQHCHAITSSPVLIEGRTGPLLIWLSPAQIPSFRPGQALSQQAG